MVSALLLFRSSALTKYFPVLMWPEGAEPAGEGDEPWWPEGDDTWPEGDKPWWPEGEEQGLNPCFPRLP